MSIARARGKQALRDRVQTQNAVSAPIIMSVGIRFQQLHYVVGHDRALFDRRRTVYSKSQGVNLQVVVCG